MLLQLHGVDLPAFGQCHDKPDGADADDGGRISERFAGCDHRDTATRGCAWEFPAPGPGALGPLSSLMLPSPKARWGARWGPTLGSTLGTPGAHVGVHVGPLSRARWAPFTLGQDPGPGPRDPGLRPRARAPEKIKTIFPKIK